MNVTKEFLQSHGCTRISQYVAKQRWEGHWHTCDSNDKITEDDCRRIYKIKTRSRARQINDTLHWKVPNEWVMINMYGWSEEKADRIIALIRAHNEKLHASYRAW